ncbi:MAG: UbiA prenyltransferase family protein [Phycisphaerae bacterium]|nr:UbiA prenyltransferase family protein [Phycisphaerae bacterium]
MWPYIQIARIDHWFKNVFILPGVMFALLTQPELLRWSAVWSILLGTAGVCLAASSNYVINEVLDARRDRLHPEKRHRPVPSGRVNVKIAIGLWITLGIIALAIGFGVNRPLGYSLSALLMSGLFYNIPPVRMKDLPYLDVIAEAINNPIRLAIGWYATGSVVWLPVSLLAAYWALGAFLMAVKRLGEYRHLNDPRRAGAYRPSFRHYNESRLLISTMCYATACSMFVGVFIARYHIELVLTVPAFAVFMAAYLRVGLKPDSPAQHPERLLRSRSMVVIVLVMTLIVGFGLWFESPTLQRFFEPTIPHQYLKPAEPAEKPTATAPATDDTTATTQAASHT